MPLLFLGGAHGAGKSSLGRELSSRLPVRILSASELIREQGVEASTPDKRVGDIDHNQELLLGALSKYRSENIAVLLDGHYCLRTSSGETAAISVEVFRRIAPDILMLLDDEPQVIVRRLRERDGHAHSFEDVAALVSCERTVAYSVSKQLGIPLCVLHAPGAVDQAVQFLSRGPV